jgi:SNF2 family DNA or RNA helicase
MKLDRALDDIMECIDEGGKPIVFTQFRSIHALIVQRLLARGVKDYAELHGDVPQGQRQHIVDEWTAYNGGIPIVCMLQVAGVGLNMVASHDVFFVDKLFVPGLNDQAIDRADRIGQTDVVHVREYIARKTVEDRIEQILETKRDTFEDVVENSVAISKIIQLLRKQGGTGP